MRNNYRTILILFLFGCCVLQNIGCHNLAHKKSIDVLNDDLKESLILQLVDEPNNPEICFLSFGSEKNEIDPPDTFLLRFKNVNPQIKKVSASKFDDDWMPIDKITNKRGYILRLSNVKWINEKEGWVKVEYYYWSWGQRGFSCRLALENGKWKILERTFGYIT